MKKFTYIFLALFFCFSPFIMACDKQEKINTYEIDAIYNEQDKTLSLSEDFYFYNDTENVISSLKFNLFGRAYRKDAKYKAVSSLQEYKAYPNGKSYGDMRVDSVLIDEKTAEYKIDGDDENILTVNLGKEIFPNESISITIKTTVFLANVVHRLGYNDKTVNLGNFYPVLCAYSEKNGFYECNYYSNGDPFYSEVANYKVSLTLPESYVVASSGSLLKEEKQNGMKTCEYTLDKARDFAFVLSKEFKSVSTTLEDTEITYYYFDDENKDSSLEYAKKSIDTFSKTFGKYPYKTYSVVQTPFLEGGMEYPALVYIDASLDKRSYGEVIVHETGHQWWYGVVGNNQIEHSFLDEGLTEYSVILFYEKNKEYGYKREDLVKICEDQYHAFCDVYKMIKGGVDTSMLRSLGEYTSSYEYVNIAYYKGAIMFEYLRQTIGDERFFSGLKKYYQKYAYSIATPYDLAGVFEKNGANTNGYFPSFFDGKVII